MTFSHDLLLYIALSLSAIADAYQASTRLHDVFTAELIEEEPVTGSGSPTVGLSPSRAIDPTMDVAIRVRNGQFTWDAAPAAPEGEVAEKGGQGGGKAGKDKSPAARVENKPGRAGEDDDGKIFKLTEIDLEIPKGKVCHRFFNFFLLPKRCVKR